MTDYRVVVHTSPHQLRGSTAGWEGEVGLVTSHDPSSPCTYSTGKRHREGPLEGPFCNVI